MVTMVMVTMVMVTVVMVTAVMVTVKKHGYFTAIFQLRLNFC